MRHAIHNEIFTARQNGIYELSQTLSNMFTRKCYTIDHVCEIRLDIESICSLKVTCRTFLFSLPSNI